MDTKKFIVGTVTGGVVYFFLGFLFYVVLLGDFFMANQGSAIGVPKEEIQYWPLILGNMSLAALLTYIFQKWANISSFVDGLKAGALVGFLVAFGFDMIMYDTTNIMNMTGALVDAVVMTINSAVAGGVIAMVAGGSN